MQVAEFFASEMLNWQRQMEAAIQTSILLLVIGAPVFYMMRAKAMDDHPRLLVTGSVTLGLTAVCNFLLNLSLAEVLPAEQFTPLGIATLSLVFALLIAVALGRLVFWTFRDIQKPKWAQDLENLPDEEMSPIDRQRKQWQERRKKAQRH